MSEELKDFFFRTLQQSEQLRIAEGVRLGLFKRSKPAAPVPNHHKRPRKPTGRACAPKNKPVKRKGKPKIKRK